MGTKLENTIKVLKMLMRKSAEKSGLIEQLQEQAAANEKKLRRQDRMLAKLRDENERLPEAPRWQGLRVLAADASRVRLPLLDNQGLDWAMSENFTLRSSSTYLGCLKYDNNQYVMLLLIVRHHFCFYLPLIFINSRGKCENHTIRSSGSRHGSFCFSTGLLCLNRVLFHGLFRGLCGSFFH